MNYTTIRPIQCSDNHIHDHIHPRSYSYLSYLLTEFRPLLYSAIHRLTCIQIIQFDILEAIDNDVLLERRTVRDEYRLQTQHVPISNFRKIAGKIQKTQYYSYWGLATALSTRLKFFYLCLSMHFMAPYWRVFLLVVMLCIVI